MKNEFGERLKELRTEEGYSLSDLSKKVGIPQSSLSRWENGKADIVSFNLIKLAKYFKVSTDYLLGLED